MLSTVLDNLFQPLLLFFYAGFLVPLLNVRLEFPRAVSQGLLIFLLLSMGWRGGVQLAALSPAEYGQAAGFMLLGFGTNLVIGCAAYLALGIFTRLRRIDAATVAGYYGSDSAGTFVTCLGVLAARNMAYASYMPVMLPIMEIPGCLLVLWLVSNLRRAGMDSHGNMPTETGERASVSSREPSTNIPNLPVAEQKPSTPDLWSAVPPPEDQQVQPASSSAWARAAIHQPHAFNTAMLHEVFLNPGMFLVFAGLAIGFAARMQGKEAAHEVNELFVKLFQGCLCLFLLEMGITAARKLKDLQAGGLSLVLFALIAPNVFATFGMMVAHVYSRATGVPFETGTYVLFAVLCGSASYIALPALQRMAIPEASPTLPLAASMGVTFSYNVTLGIPLYIAIAQRFLAEQNIPSGAIMP